MVRAMAHPILFDPVPDHLVGFDGSWKVHKASTAPPQGADDKLDNKAALDRAVHQIAKLQGKLYAHDRYAMLLIFQAMDAAGKDGTIRAVMSGINPQGCQVYAFKSPSHEELDHDFLWRVQRDLPERGRIGIFNRSHYEEVLMVRVNPKYLDAQKLPHRPKSLSDLWEQRYESIAAAEKHWARSGTVVLKFFLNVSQRAQHERFLDRISDKDNHWKYDATDMTESRKWDPYMEAYQDALRATSKPWAPWYSIPADDKPYMRRAVAEIVAGTLAQLPLAYPEVTDQTRAEMAELRKELEAK